MKHAHALFLAMALGMAGRYPAMPGTDAPFPSPGPRRRAGPPETSPRTVACPKCHAEPGQPCDRRTLGRHAYHLAREQAVKP